MGGSDTSGYKLYQKAHTKMLKCLSIYYILSMVAKTEAITIF